MMTTSEAAFKSEMIELRAQRLNRNQSGDLHRWVEKCGGCGTHTKWLGFKGDDWYCGQCRSDIENALRR